MKDTTDRAAVEKGLEDARQDRANSFRRENIVVPSGVKTPPYPGVESVGPAMVDLITQTKKSIIDNANLVADALGHLHKRNVIEYVSQTTDASGNADIKLYQVPQGYHFTATRVNIEGGAFTPASPFAAAAAWLALIRGAVFAAGSIIDFGPASVGGTIIPSIFSTSDSHAPALNGGEILTLHIVGGAGLATTEIWARLQGILTPL